MVAEYVNGGPADGGVECGWGVVGSAGLGVSCSFTSDVRYRRPSSSAAALLCLSVHILRLALDRVGYLCLCLLLADADLKNASRASLSRYLLFVLHAGMGLGLGFGAVRVGFCVRRVLGRFSAIVIDTADSIAHSCPPRVSVRRQLL